MVSMITLNSREDWLNHRTGIGGSDAATIIGYNPYKSNVRLWQEKTGRVKPDDISDKPYVKYGNEAEPHLRKLFALDFPQFRVMYQENNMWKNDKFPFAHASLDGWLIDGHTKQTGILEIKTSEISSAVQRKKWDEQIPMNYYCQVLWYLMVTEFDFAYLKAQLKTVIGDEVSAQIKHYRIDRKDVQSDIDYLAEQAERFWWFVEKDKEPPLLLPNI